MASTGAPASVTNLPKQPGDGAHGVNCGIKWHIIFWIGICLLAISKRMDELSKLTEENRLRAMERFRLLQPHLEQGRVLSEVAKEAGVPYRTAWRWMNLYRQSVLLLWPARAARMSADGGY